MKRLLAIVLSVVLMFSVVSTDVFVMDVKATSSGFYGYLEYRIEDGEVEITDCSTDIRGNIIIPSILGGYPVTRISGWAFDNCNLLTSVTIPDSVNDIGVSEFEGCGLLTEIKVSSDNENYCDIDGVLFNKNKKRLICCPGGRNGEYNIPNGVTEIDSCAFDSCSLLTSVTIPDSVNLIRGPAFRNCGMLTKIEVSSNNENYCDIDGVLFNKSKERLSCCPGGRSDSYKIPDGVMFIECAAFSDCSLLENVIIPDSVICIDSYAFDGCSSLASIIIPSGVATIGYAAFQDCSLLTSVTMSDTVINIEGSAFCGCSSLTSIRIPNSVKTLENGVFEKCTSLVSIEIPASVTTIEQSAFYICASLETVIIPNSVTDIAWGAFERCYNLKKVYYLGDINEWCRINFKNYFSDSDSYSAYYSNPLFYADELYLNGEQLARDVVLSNDVTQIPDCAFKNQPITNITIPDSVTSVGNYAFCQCENIRRIELPKHITTIDSNAFAWSKLKVIYIPDSNVSINEDAFYNTHINYVYYGGDEESRSKLNIESGNDSLKNAIWIYEQMGLPSHEYDNDCDNICNLCESVREVPKRECLKHTWDSGNITKQAGYKETGTKTYTCTICQNTKVEQISAISSVMLSATKYTYTGSKKTPSVTVKDSKGKKLVSGTDYKLSYSSTSRKAVGKYYVKIIFMGKYDGSKTLYFTIVPKNSSSIKATLYGYDDVKITWSKVSGASGYKVYYKKSTSRTWSSKTTTGTSMKLANLADGVKYDIKVVTYKMVGGDKYYSTGKSTSIYTLKKIIGVKAQKSGTKVKISWTNISGETGYQISQSTKKSGTKVVATYKTTSGKYKNISATRGKTYYYKVRSYKVMNGKKIYSPWSTAVKYIRK